MNENKATVLAWVGLSEGGFVNHPQDPGGATDRGITQKTFDAYNDRIGQQRRAVRGISKELADKIVADNYLAPIKFDLLPSGLDYSVADFAVNSGVQRAAKELQRIVGQAQDGVIGDLTLGAVATYPGGVQQLVTAYNARRMQYLRSLRTFKTFGRGWTARVEGNVAGAQENDIGVVDRSSRLARIGAQGLAGQAESMIPQPTISAPGKARDEDQGVTSIVGKVLSDPVAVIPAIGTVVASLSDLSGPISWALAGVILIVGVYALTRALKRPS